MSHMLRWERWTLSADGDDFGQSRWKASKCCSECPDLHSWHVTYKVSLQITLIFGIFRLPQTEFLGLCSKEPTYTGSSHWGQSLAVPQKLSYGVMQHVLTSQDSGGWSGDMVWFSLKQKWEVGEVQFGHSYLSPSQLCYFSFFYHLFLSFLVLRVYWLNIFQTSVIPLYITSRILLNNCNQYWFI